MIEMTVDQKIMAAIVQADMFIEQYHPYIYMFIIFFVTIILMMIVNGNHNKFG